MSKSKAAQAIEKFESRNLDVVVVRIPFKDVKNLRDMNDAKDVSKFITSSNELSGFKVNDVTSVIDGDKKELRIMIDIQGRVDHSKVQNIIKDLFK